MKIILILLFIFPITAEAREWSRADTYREVIYESLVLIDLGTTHDALYHHNDCHEENPIIGKHPQQEQLDFEVITVMLIHPIIAYYLPEKYRAPFQYISIGIETGAVLNNFSIGLKVNF